MLYAVGSAGVWKTTDRGDNWTLFRRQELANDIAVDPGDSRVVYLASREALRKTIDGGATWTTLQGASGGRVVLINPADRNEIYLAGTGAVLHSRDGGLTWEQLNIPGVTAALWDMDIHSSSPRVIMAGVDGELELWRSEDGGVTWDKVFSRGGGRTPVKLSPQDPQVIFTSKGVSRDGGITWGPAPEAWGIAVHPLNPQLVYYGQPDFNVTVDGGLSFVMVNSQENYNSGEIEDFAIDPVNDLLYVASDTLFRGAGAATGKVLVEEITRGVYGMNLTDLETTRWAVWVSSDTRGVHKSEDWGGTWRYDILGTFGLDSIRSIAPDPNDPYVIYAGQESALFKSVDGGRSWADLLPAKFPVVTVDHRNPGAVYYGTRDEKLFRSTDAGLTWQELPQAGRRVFLHPVDAAVVYTLHGGKLHRSSDRGQTWTALGEVRGSLLDILPGNSEVMYAPADTAGLFRSSDGGLTWTKQNITGRRPRKVLQTGDGSLWLATLDAGVFRSINGGVSWELVADIAAIGLAPDPNLPQAAFALTTGSEAGVWWLHPQGQARPALPPPAPQEPDLRTVPVSQCQVLERSNTVYELTQDLRPLGSGSCFLFPQGVHDITLDGRGHKVEFGSPAIVGEGIRNLVIKNLTLSQHGDNGPGRGGIVLTNAQGVQVLDNDVTTRFRNEDAIRVTGILTEDVEISGNTVTVGPFAAGIVANGDKVVVRNNVVNVPAPGGDGIQLVGAPDAQVLDNQVSIMGGGDYYGIRVLASPGASVRGNRVSGSFNRGGKAIEVAHSPNAVVAANTPQ